MRMLRIRTLALATLGAGLLIQFGPIPSPASAALKPPRAFVEAPDPAAVSVGDKPAPGGAVVRNVAVSFPPSGDYNHVHQLSSAQVKALEGRTRMREVHSSDGLLTGLIAVPTGTLEVSIEDGVLASGRQVIAFGAGAVQSRAASVSGLVIDAAAYTRQFTKCSYETIDPNTGNLFVYICATDVGPMSGIIVAIMSAIGAGIGFVAGGPIGALVGALVGAALSIAVIAGVWRIENADGSITLTIPAFVWQNLSGWFGFGTGQNVYVNGNPCQVYYEGLGWYQGCQVSDTFNWVGVDFDGRLETFVIGGGYNMYSKAQTCNPGCGWTGWYNHGGGNLVSRPTVGSDVDGELNAMAIGSNGWVRESYQAGGPGSMSWSSWYNLQCCFTGNVAMGRNADGRLEAVVRNANGNIDHLYETSQNGLWNGYGHLMCCFASSPAIESNTDGRLEVFAIDNYHYLWHIYQTAPNGGWSAMQNLGCCLIGNPQTTRFADGSLAVFGIGTDHNLYYQRQTSAGAGWSGWRGLGGGGILSSDPVVRQNVDGRLEAFVIDSNLHLRDVWETAPNAGWSGWGDLGCCIKGNPDVQINTNGVLEAFGIGTDNALYHKWQSAPGQGPWSPWYSLGGVIIVNP
jgi:hypothetical protein